MYAADCMYHVYNRGVEQRIIFIDAQDYHVFLRYVSDALMMPMPEISPASLRTALRKPKNFYGKVECLAFALMPNHFHFLFRQITETAIKEFLQSVCTRYTAYFNTKYKRIGTLYESSYKAVLVDTDDYAIWITRYIHRNPLEAGLPLHGPYSSYDTYLGKLPYPWVIVEPIRGTFGASSIEYLKHGAKSPIESYRNFVESGDISDSPDAPSFDD